MEVGALLVHPAMAPFVSAFVLIVALVLLEIVMMAVGLSSDTGSDGVDADGGVDADADFDLDADLEAGLEPDQIADIIAGLDTNAEGLDLDAPGGEMGAPDLGAFGQALAFTGFGQTPFTFWLASLAAGFSISGYLLQLAVAGATGAPLSAPLASVIAIAPAIWLGGRFAKFFARVAPKSESSAISMRSYGRRRGVITVGTARVGQPAQARFTDHHGNMHYLMVEPFDADEAIPEGTEILILRRAGGAFVAIATSEIVS